MKISYSNTMDDALEFNKHHYRYSDTVKKQKVNLMVKAPIFILLVILFIYQLTGEIKVLIYGTIFCGLLIYFTHRQFTTGILKTAKKMLEEGGMSGFVCDHELEINEEWIFEKTQYNETKTFWNQETNIAENENFAFIYIQSAQAHVIPKERILNGNYEEFIKTAKQYIQNVNS